MRDKVSDTLQHLNEGWASVHKDQEVIASVNEMCSKYLCYMAVEQVCGVPKERVRRSSKTRRQAFSVFEFYATTGTVH